MFMKVDGVLFYKAQLEIKKVFDIIDDNLLSLFPDQDFHYLP